MKSRIIDCITFFDNNFMFEIRYNILKDYVDYFVICESGEDHMGRKKNFKHNKIIDNFLQNLDKEKNFNDSFYYNFSSSRYNTIFYSKKFKFSSI